MGKKAKRKRRLTSHGRDFLKTRKVGLLSVFLSFVLLRWFTSKYYLASLSSCKYAAFPAFREALGLIFLDSRITFPVYM